MIPRDRECLHFTGAAAGDHDGKLASEFNPLFDDDGAVGGQCAGGIEIVLGSDAGLTAAVVAATRRLGDAATEFAVGIGDFRWRARDAEWGAGKAVRAQPFLLPSAILNDVDRCGARAHGCMQRGGGDAGRRDLLDVERDHIAGARECRRRLRVVVARGDHVRGDGRGGTIRIRIEHMHVVAHRSRCERRHPCQLPATEKSNRAARQNRAHAVGRGSG